MRLLPWFLNPWHVRGDVSGFALPRQRGALLEKLSIALCRKIPGLAGLLGVRLGSWPNEVPGAPIEITRVDEDRSSLTFLGHRTVYIQTGGAAFLTDPLFSRRLYFPLFGLRRVTNRVIKFWKCPMPDFVLLSNNAYGCVDSFSMRRLGDAGAALVLGGMNVSRYVMFFFRGYTYPLRWYETVNFGSVEVTFLPSCSNSGRRWYNRDLLLWGSFFIRSATKSVYYAGRTAYGSHFREIREFLCRQGHSIDVAILPLGPVFRRSPELTPEQAVTAHMELGARKTLVVAHDTFPLGVEGYGELVERLYRRISEVDPSLREKFIVLREGEAADITDLEGTCTDDRNGAANAPGEVGSQQET
ncbi:-N-acyl-phosphatidylethanolamine-hydrolyzing phospholipase D [Babesia bigemina]|uniref:-N-acyl-phosphatidylethanolamine-hydrolyzing phospholipase D n=1 Tax=Babesia bigemina TaxID=5866 RepID=A0A061DER6_BABBI|nr:-N-acyl-phosphatidylethanolamine-hydrolyzing phospholipase D [Babesia bigemina]CDR97745.1 -N-acyl-phosphatidylethanolamine-hydrolyzing phospholipase D [Babesia bigemina]|eukprot:XP_012769931.1 -N-acyl-phosphatidylethanolamine-hydrolyzing phospholipase D [Babesia bigemina]